MPITALSALIIKEIRDYPMAIIGKF